MNLNRSIRVTHDPDTDRVHVQLRQRHRKGGSTLIPLQWIARADLRELCDVLHDYADELDRNTQEARTTASSRVRRSEQATPPHGPRTPEPARTPVSAPAAAAHTAALPGRGVDASTTSTANHFARSETSLSRTPPPSRARANTERSSS